MLKRQRNLKQKRDSAAKRKLAKSLCPKPKVKGKLARQSAHNISTSPSHSDLSDVDLSHASESDSVPPPRSVETQDHQAVQETITMSDDHSKDFDGFPKQPITVDVLVSESTKAFFVAQGFTNVNWSDPD